MPDKRLITKEGYENIKVELAKLSKVDRHKIIKDIAEARAHGDLKENAEYHAAKERQGWIEGRIQSINYILANAEVIEISKTNTKKIQFGATVTYENTETEEQNTWKIVGEDESDFKLGKISVKSPIARSLLGKKAGDEIEIKIPKGKLEVEIISVEYI